MAPSTKRCPRCRETRSIDQFARDRRTRDGRKCWCKPCARSATRRYDRSDVGRRKQRERKRREYARASWHFDAHPEQRQAQHKVAKAIERGELIRPAACDRCGDQPAPGIDGRSRINAHHADYSRPLAVEWLCRPCHAIADTERREVVAA